jgi:hypothetical protein
VSIRMIARGSTAAEGTRRNGSRDNAAESCRGAEPMLRLAPSQFKHHRIVGIGTGHSRLVPHALPREGSSRLQNRSKRPHRTECPGTHPRGGSLADQELITNFMPKSTGPLLRYDPCHDILHLCHADTDLPPVRMQSEVDGELAILVQQLAIRSYLAAAAQIADHVPVNG